MDQKFGFGNGWVRVAAVITDQGGADDVSGRETSKKGSDKGDEVAEVVVRVKGEELSSSSAVLFDAFGVS